MNSVLLKLFIYSTSIYCVFSIILGNDDIPKHTQSPVRYEVCMLLGTEKQI